MTEIDTRFKAIEERLDAIEHLLATRVKIKSDAEIEYHAAVSGLLRAVSGKELAEKGFL